jgi:outer membrane lipoprotein SlyB
MNKRTVLFIIVGAVVGGYFGARIGAYSNNAAPSIIVGAVAGALVGLFGGGNPTGERD